MRSTHLLLAAVVAILMATATGAGVSLAVTPTPTPVAVPLNVERGRLVAEVAVDGSRPLRVVVDTGSSGLRVLADRVPAGGVARGVPARPYGYVSGIRLAGTTVRAPVRLGGVPSAAPVPVELVTGTTCAPDQPRCAAANGRRPDFMGGGYDGVLGIAPLSTGDVPNPLWYFGPVGRAYTVHVDLARTSTLVLSDPPTGFTLDQLARTAPATGDGPPAWQSRVPACFTVGPQPALPGGRVCGPTLFDTGNPALAVVPFPGAPAGLHVGAPLALATPDGRWSGSYTVGPARRVAIGTPPHPMGLAAGLPAFITTDVRIDLAAGTLGLRRR